MQSHRRRLFHGGGKGRNMFSRPSSAAVGQDLAQVSSRMLDLCQGFPVSFRKGLCRRGPRAAIERGWRDLSVGLDVDSDGPVNVLSK